MNEPTFAQVLDRLRTILDEANDYILEREIVLGYKWTFYEVLRANGEWVVCYDNIPLNVPKRIAAVKNLKDF